MAKLPIRMNDNNEDVKELHTILKELGYPVKNVTEYFDNRTYNIVKAFQNDKGLDVTGTVDERTWEALGNKAKRIELENAYQVREEKEVIKKILSEQKKIGKFFIDEMGKNQSEENKFKDRTAEETRTEQKKLGKFFVEEGILLESRENTENKAHININEIIRKGNKGENVRELQNKLIILGYLPTGTANAIFENETYEAVRNFQRDNGLVVDGIVGPKTWRILDMMFKV